MAPTISKPCPEGEEERSPSGPRPEGEEERSPSGPRPEGEEERSPSGWFHTYVLISEADAKFYIGFTSRDVSERLQEHNEGLTKSTASRRPFRLIYYETHPSKSDALRRESYFKTSAGERTLRLMLRDALNKRVP